MISSLSCLSTQELHVASKGDIDTDSFLLIIGPFLRAVQGTQDSAFFDRVSKKVFSAFVKSFGRENPVVIDSSEDESRRFGDVESKALQSFLFDMASDADTAEKNRKKLYTLHQEFPALTGEDFVTSEETDEQQEEEEEVEEEIVVKKKTTKKNGKILETSDQKIKKVTKQVMDNVATEEVKVVVEEKKVSSELIDKKAAKEARKEALKALKFAEEVAAKKAEDIEEAIATATALAAAAAAAASKGNKIKKVKRTREELEEEAEDVPVHKSKKEKVSKESSKATVAVPIPMPAAAVKTVVAVKTVAAVAAVAVAPIVPASVPLPLEPYVAMKKFGGQKVNYVFKKVIRCAPVTACNQWI